MKRGNVYLVGAGPGDPGLISVKGLDCLKHADVIVYDHLIDDSLLDSARPEAEKIDVGKTPKHHAREQDEINRLLVEKAQQGKMVVRLKGGDPFILGRGGEEAQALAQNQVAFEVVPGVSSAAAVPAYAGIPVTHRGLASSFAVITGHEDPGKSKSAIDWEKLATGPDTLVFLMGVANLSQIVAELVAHGRVPPTPIAVIREGCGPRQDTIVGTLDDIVAKVAVREFAPPAVIVVGEVVRLREELRWFDSRPLFGKRILVTRARHQASTLSRLLTANGAQPVEMPVIDIQAVPDTDELDRAILDLDTYQWIVFTSVNGVEAFSQRLHALGLDARRLRLTKVGAIGPSTAQALEKNGLRPDYTPETYTGEGIVAGFKTHNDVAGRRFLLPRADIAGKELSDGLARLGAEVHEVAAYRTVPLCQLDSGSKQMLLSGQIDVVTFASSSTVTNLLALLDNQPSAINNNATTACIGPTTAGTARRAGLRVDIVARESTIRGLVEAMEEYYQAEKSDAGRST